MIVELSAENIAILERCQISLGPGFTALTGETGAGKSLLIDAIGLALGERADSDLVRTGAARGVVTMTVDLSTHAAAQVLCEELGVDLEDSLLYIQREISAEGRSAARIGGKLVSLGVLRQIGAILVDLHGQHEHQSLMNPERHLDLLDRFAGSSIKLLRDQVGDLYRQVEFIRNQLRQLTTSERARLHRIDLLQFQIQEIEQVSPAPGEVEMLKAQLNRLEHASRLVEATAGARAIIDGEETGVRDQIRMALKRIESAAALDTTLKTRVESLESALVIVDEVSAEFASYQDSLESNPGELEEVATRLDHLQRLLRKYGDSEEAILLSLEEARQELDLLLNAEASTAQLQSELEKLEGKLSKAGDALSRARREKADELTQLIVPEIQSLAMEKAQFETRIERGPMTENGQDRVEFYFTANPGEGLRPLAKIASGGELSRLMLAIKVVTAGQGGVPSLIFDEVDTGLSGRAAAIAARKLQNLARHEQVIVISHLPQIAAAATSHFRITKTEERGRVQTTITSLSEDERLHEIARMLAGETVGDSAIANARELIDLNADPNVAASLG